MAQAVAQLQLQVFHMALLKPHITQVRHTVQEDGDSSCRVLTWHLLALQ